MYLPIFYNKIPENSTLDIKWKGILRKNLKISIKYTAAQEMGENPGQNVRIKLTYLPGNAIILI